MNRKKTLNDPPGRRARIADYLSLERNVVAASGAVFRLRWLSGLLVRTFLAFRFRWARVRDGLAEHGFTGNLRGYRRCAAHRKTCDGIFDSIDPEARAHRHRAGYRRNNHRVARYRYGSSSRANNYSSHCRDDVSAYKTHQHHQ